MIAGFPIAGHPIASPLILARSTVSSPKGGGGVDLRAKLLREDDEILAVIMSYMLKDKWRGR